MGLLCSQFGREHYVRRTLIVFASLLVAASPAAVGQNFTVTDLGTLPHGFFSVARGINNRGQIVGDSETNGLFQPHVFLVRRGPMVDLGILSGGDFSEATGINNRGEIVGFSGATARFEFAFLVKNG